MTQKPLRLSLVTYNIHKGFSGLGKKFLLPEMRQALVELDTDFVFLQEVQGLHHRRARRVTHWPEGLQSDYLAADTWPYHIYAKNAVYQAGHHGNAILSKFPFVHYENINISARHRASRSILHAQVALPHIQRNLHLLCVHFGLFKNERAAQYQTLLKRIQEVVPEHEPLLMAGDFNDWQLHLSQPLAQELNLTEAFYHCYGQHTRSFPALKPTLCMDRIYFRGINLIKAQCFKEKPWRTLSDHLPLSAWFDI
ncbi:MAG TPA: hypothetical protein DCG13_04420 [Legionellales bacterium]|nr:hypothetical protein [Legionellales bacterium]HCA88872.1 hypothetical protein [Legionellales bacterium]|tara:strand:- start:1343 stop:2101 length:759 start_codon:yes stop_codon:yes gene_type:complete